MGNIKAVKFEITRAEGPTHLCGQKTPVSSWKEADAIFSEVAKTAPTTGGYDKCDFRITFEDGETYEGRMDVKGNPDENETLAQHVGQLARFYAGRWKPDHLTQQQYDDFLTQTKATTPDWLRRMLSSWTSTKFRLTDPTTTKPVECAE